MKKPSLEGSPYNTATFAPAGSDSGPSLQGTSLGVYNAQVPGGVFSRSVPAPVATASGLAARDSAKTTRAATRFIGSPPIRDAPTSFRGHLATVV